MCVSPKAIKVYNKYTHSYKVVSVPCQHCYECVRKRKLDWEMRLTVESSASAHTFFGMLTYNDEFYHEDIQVKELQYFIKRLRYNLNLYYPGSTLKYFLVSEFGELKDRLHYHVLYMVSKEFTDTFREFEELCKMSWVRKVLVDDEQKAWRKNVFSRYVKTHGKKQTEELVEMRKWSRRKYDDISIGFATAKNLKGGTAVGSIHYACKYIQKQYNKRLSSHMGYDVWREMMVRNGLLKLNATCDKKDIVPICEKYLFSPSFTEYPSFPLRGTPYPIPRRWLLNTVGKGYTQFLTAKLVADLLKTDKVINLDRVQYHWYKEPERLSFVCSKESEEIISRANSFKERVLFYDAFPHDKLEKEWQTILTPRRMLSCPVEVNLTYPIETRLPLKWDS